MSDLIVDATRTARATENTANHGHSFLHALADAKAQAPDDPPRPSKPVQEDTTPPHEGGFSGLWHDAVSDVKSAYNTANGAVHDFGRAADQVVQGGIDGATSGIRDVAGAKAADLFHDAAQGLHDEAKQTVGFAYGVDEGAIEAVGGMAEGVGDLAEDGVKFATDRQFRGQVVDGAKTLASHVMHDPVGSAKALGNRALQAGKDWLHGADAAAHNGTLGEYIGKSAGSAAVNIGSLFVPGADAAEGANIASRVGEAGELAGDAAKALHTGEAAEHAVNPVVISLRGVEHTIPDWHLEDISYTKRAPEARDALRQTFNSHVRKDFVQDLAENHADDLKAAGLKPKQIERMASGRLPEGYQVHHILPLDDGGTNATSNLVLIKNDPDHMLITQYQNSTTHGMEAGDMRHLEWPMPDHPVSVWPERPGGGAKPVMPEDAAQ